MRWPSASRAWMLLAALASAMPALTGCGSESQVSEPPAQDRKLADVKQARLQLIRIEEAVIWFRMTHKRIPDTLADVTRSDKADRDPPLKAIPRDPWGHEYEYLRQGEKAYVLRSLGPDGRPDTTDDVVYPE